MATAKRVGQDRKAVPVERSQYVKREVTTEVDGIVINRCIPASYYQTVRDVAYEDQPDRVVLEMSLEEAYALIHFAMDGSTPHLKKDATAVANAVENARLSSPASTQSSPAQDESCGKAPYNRNPLYTKPGGGLA